MNITIDLDDQDAAPVYFPSKEEWDQSPCSKAGRKLHWRHGLYMPVYRNEPSRFPCYCFDGDLIYRLDGPDEYANYFIYPTTN